LDDGLIEIRAKNAKTASRRMIPIVPTLKEWLLSYRRDNGPVCDYNNVGFTLHKLTKGINEARRAAWAKKHGKTVDELAANVEKAKKNAKPQLRKRQKRDVPPGAETAEIEGWTPFGWKHNAMRHSFISYRLAEVNDVAKVSLEAGNTPQMIFKHYRELVRPTDSQKWFAVTFASVNTFKEARRKAAEESPNNVVSIDTAQAA
jgi:hypothetical protein